MPCQLRGWDTPVTPPPSFSTELARSSQQNLQRTVKYGGRQKLPPPGEMQAFLVLGLSCNGWGWLEVESRDL